MPKLDHKPSADEDSYGSTSCAQWFKDTDGISDLWVIGEEVTRFDLPQIFARLRHSSHRRPPRTHLEAMSADVVLA